MPKIKYGGGLSRRQGGRANETSVLKYIEAYEKWHFERYGIEKEYPHTTSIARIFGVSRERVRQYLMRLIVKVGVDYRTNIREIK